jgi:hypothetical protein
MESIRTTHFIDQILNLGVLESQTFEEDGDLITKFISVDRSTSARIPVSDEEIPIEAAVEYLRRLGLSGDAKEILGL